MRKFLLMMTCFLAWGSSFAQNGQIYLKKEDIEKDLAYLSNVLQNQSSYQGLNGYNYQDDFERYLAEMNGKPVSKYHFGLFLSKTIGKIGDRHATIQGYELRDSLYLPFSFAPFNDKVLVLNYQSEKKEYGFLDTDFPFLKSINNVPIQKILSSLLPEEILAPKSSYFTRSIKLLRDIEIVFKRLQLELPNPLPIVLTNQEGTEKRIAVTLVSASRRARYWDEQFFNNTYKLASEKYNDKNFVNRFFKLEDNIGYIQLVDMLDKEESHNFFMALNNFMANASESDALIIDIRDNGGGTRDLIQELAGYFVSPDSIYVVNTARQRADLPLDNELKQRLHDRYLYAKEELDIREQNAVDKFMTSFKPSYSLDDQKFSTYYYHVFNGEKIAKNKYYYKKPVYVLVNEKVFSAASILTSVFKGLPNIKIVGVNTDGSSGNSEKVELPNSKLGLKISTMVSFQKDGKLLDGVGTAPDRVIERNLNQILFKEDFQLKELMKIIKEQ